MTQYGRIRVELTAMQDLIVSAAEAYDHESLGLLFGQEKSGQLIVDRAFAFQIVASRSQTRVQMDPKAKKRLLEIVHALGLAGDFVGHFHSHPSPSPVLSFSRLSGEDFQAMRPGEIELVVSVQPAMERQGMVRHKGPQIECNAGHFRFIVIGAEVSQFDGRRDFRKLELLTDEEFLGTNRP